MMWKLRLLKNKLFFRLLPPNISEKSKLIVLNSRSLNIILGVLPVSKASESYSGTNLLTDVFKELIILRCNVSKEYFHDR